MYETIGRSLGTDYFRIADQLTEEDLDYWRRTRDFVDDEVLPVINDYWERAEPHWPLIKRLGELGIVGEGISGHGCPGMSPLAAGLVAMELNRGDGSIGTVVGVQAGLAMQSIDMLGSEGQKQRWLPGMARMEKFGAFALTEPLHGSDSIALETSARRDTNDWVINGQRIGHTLADVVVLWARDVADGKVKGFLIEKDSPGYAANRIDGKGSLRAIWQAETPHQPAGPGMEPAPGGQKLQGHWRSCGRHPQPSRLGSPRARRRLRHRRRIHPTAGAVRQTVGQLPDRADPAGQGARRGLFHAEYCLQMGRLKEQGSSPTPSPPSRR